MFVDSGLQDAKTQATIHDVVKLQEVMILFQSTQVKQMITTGKVHVEELHSQLPPNTLQANAAETADFTIIVISPIQNPFPYQLIRTDWALSIQDPTLQGHLTLFNIDLGIHLHLYERVDASQEPSCPHWEDIGVPPSTHC